MASTNSGAVLPGEELWIAKLLQPFGEPSVQEAYASWLDEQADSRGKFFRDFWSAFRRKAKLPDMSAFPLPWRKIVGISFVEAMVQTDLVAYQESLFSLVKPTLSLVVIENEDGERSEDSLPLGTSKLGGLPDLSDGMAWPTSAQGAFAFLCQINLRDIAGTQVARELPENGLLSFFALTDSNEFTVIESGGNWRVIWTPETTGLSRLTASTKLDDVNQVVPARSLQFFENLDLPCSSWEKELGFSWDDFHSGRSKAMDAYCFEFADRLGSSNAKLLGYCHPSVLGGDPTQDLHKRHLLTLLSDTWWNWGDGHQLMFFIADEDLKNSRFDAVTVLDG